MYDISDILYIRSSVRKIKEMVYWEHDVDEKYIDPTGTILTPGFHGETCQGNGDHPGIECCCDECDFFLICFPDWRELWG